MSRCQRCEHEQRFEHKDALDCIEQLQDALSEASAPVTVADPLSLGNIVTTLLNAVGIGIGMGILRFGRKGRAGGLRRWRRKPLNRRMKNELRYVRRRRAK